MLKLINELGPEAVFDPETLRGLTAAFDAAWAAIEATGAPFSDANYAKTASGINSSCATERSFSWPDQI
jgi:hypothetical protein